MARPNLDVEDPTRVKTIAERILAVQRKNNPEGLPKEIENQNKTDPAFPLLKEMPKDLGWRQVDTIAGSGDGPELGAVGGL